MKVPAERLSERKITVEGRDTVGEEGVNGYDTWESLASAARAPAENEATAAEWAASSSFWYLKKGMGYGREGAP